MKDETSIEREGAKERDGAAGLREGEEVRRIRDAGLFKDAGEMHIFRYESFDDRFL